MCGDDVRPRARTILKWEQLEVGQVVMVNYNIEIPEERGFWFDAEITALNEVSRTNKEVWVKILLGWEYYQSQGVQYILYVNLSPL